MIVDTLKNCAMYNSVNSGFEKGFEFIKNYMQKEVPVGRYDLDGDKVYALVQSYDTIPESAAKWETHRKYIDIQFVAKGKEIIGWAPIDALAPNTEYSEEKDVTFYENGEGTAVKLADGQFAIFFPEDNHKPKCIWDNAGSVKKIVVKVKI